VVSCHAIRSQLAYIYIRGEFHEARGRWRRLSPRRGRRLRGQERPRHGNRRRDPRAPRRRLLRVRRGDGPHRVARGKRGQPRIKPPFPAVVASTAARRSSTTSRRSRTCRSSSPAGRSGSRATAPRRTAAEAYSISGHVKRPGSYEAPMGKITLATSSSARATPGHPRGRKLKAVVPAAPRPPSSPPPRSTSRWTSTACEGRLHARLRRHRRDGRLHLHGVDGEEPHLLLQARVLRQVLALPRGHGWMLRLSGGSRRARPRRPTSTSSGR